MAWLVVAVPDVFYLCVGCSAVVASRQLGAEDRLGSSDGMFGLPDRYSGSGDYGKAGRKCLQFDYLYFAFQFIGRCGSAFALSLGGATC